MWTFDLPEDFDSILFYDREEFRRQESEELGKTKKAKEIAKNLLNEKLDIELISKATGLTIKEIEDLQSNINE